MSKIFHFVEHQRTEDIWKPLPCRACEKHFSNGRNSCQPQEHHAKEKVLSIHVDGSSLVKSYRIHVSEKLSPCNEYGEEILGRLGQKTAHHGEKAYRVSQCGVAVPRHRGYQPRNIVRMSLVLNTHWFRIRMFILEHPVGSVGKHSGQILIFHAFKSPCCHPTDYAQSPTWGTKSLGSASTRSRCAFFN